MDEKEFKALANRIVQRLVYEGIIKYDESPYYTNEDEEVEADDGIMKEAVDVVESVLYDVIEHGGDQEQE